MGFLESIVKGDGEDPAMLAKAIMPLVELYPLVGELLTGAGKPDSENHIGKFYLSISLESDGLVVRCSQKSVDTALYVKISDPVAVWQSLETALKAGQFTRRRSDKRTPSF